MASGWYLVCPSIFSADTRLAPSQWETSLQSNTVFYWVGASLKSALYIQCYIRDINTLEQSDTICRQASWTTLALVLTCRLFWPIPELMMIYWLLDILGKTKSVTFLSIFKYFLSSTYIGQFVPTSMCKRSWYSKASIFMETALSAW